MLQIVARQMLVMGIFMVLGILLFKGKLITMDGSKTMSNLLIYIITPAAIFRSFCIPRTPEKVKAFLISFALCAFAQGLGVLFSHLIYKKKPMQEYATTYSNSGFFGIPVIQACLGTEAVFYSATLVVFVGTLQHTYGASLLLGSKKTLNLKRILLAPNVVGLVLGLIVFFSGLGTKIPRIVSQCVNSLADMTAFMGMAVLGVLLCQADLKQLYKDIEIYVISILRLLIIPLVCAVIFRFIPVAYEIKYAILLSFAGPVGSNIANYTLLYNKNYGLATLYVTTSTVLCLGTLPLFAAIIEKIL